MRRASLACLGLGMSIIGGACTSNTHSPEAAPTTVEVSSAPVDALNERLGDIGQFIGPIAVRWESCPSEGTALSPDMRVNAFVFENGAYGDRTDGLPKLYHTVAIGEVREYRDREGNVAAWCGKNIVEEANHPEVQGPEGASIVVIPAKPNCPQPEAGQIIPCMGMPLLYDHGPNDYPGTTRINPTPPTTVLPTA